MHLFCFNFYAEKEQTQLGGNMEMGLSEFGKFDEYSEPIEPIDDTFPEELESEETAFIEPMEQSEELMDSIEEPPESETVESLDDLSDEDPEELVEPADSSEFEDLADPAEVEEDIPCDTEGLADEAVQEENEPELVSIADAEDQESLSDNSSEVGDTDGDEQLLEDEEQPEPDELSEEEKSEIIKDFVDQNVSPAVLPKSKGHWEGEEGDSKWIPDEDATVTWRKGGETHTETYGEMMEQHDIDGIEYFNNEPDFSEMEDSFIQHAELEHFSDERTGSGGTYTMASEAVAERLSRETGEEWTSQRVQAYMNDHGLTWHECADRKTVRAVPTEINAGFKHSGGISVEKSVSAAAQSLDERYDLGKGYALDTRGGMTVENAEELNAAIQANKEEFRRQKRSQK